MKIILFGANGMLGSYISDYLSSSFEVINMTRNELSLTSSPIEIIDQIEQLVTSDDVIINAAGIIKQREYNVLELIQVNAIFPHLLSSIKKTIGCEVIHITTDCVFSGLNGYYIETDMHDCLDDYGKSKSLGENPELTIIRTSIIGHEKTNKRSLLEWVISNKNNTIKGYQDHFWNGVTCLELSKFIYKLIEEKKYWDGVRHIMSPESVSKYQLLHMINETYNLNLTIEEYITPIQCWRNLNTIYSRVIEKSLKQQLIELKEYYETKNI